MLTIHNDLFLHRTQKEHPLVGFDTLIHLLHLKEDAQSFFAALYLGCENWFFMHLVTVSMA